MKGLAPYGTNSILCCTPQGAMEFEQKAYRFQWLLMVTLVSLSARRTSSLP